MTLPCDQDRTDDPSDAPSNNASRLDPEAFPPFARLLQASQDYARYSGCRFHSSSFDALGSSQDKDEDDRGDPASVEPRLAAKRQAEPVVREYSERLRSGEAALLGELERAFNLLMAESVRSAMVATCRRLDLWPPAPTQEANAASFRVNKQRENENPEGEEQKKEEHKKEASLEEIPAIAQRLFDEEAERQAAEYAKTGDALGACGSGPAEELRTARTAAFLVDFAHEAGVPRPEMPVTESNRLQEFMDSASNFERAQQDMRRGAPTEGVEAVDGAAEEEVVDPNSWRAKLASSLLVVGAVVILL